MSAQRRKGSTALLILDMISEFRFPDAERVLRGARCPARAIGRLKSRARKADVPVIYREYELIIPSDCVGATSREETQHALFIARRALNARVVRQILLDLKST